MASENEKHEVDRIKKEFALQRELERETIARAEVVVDQLIDLLNSMGFSVEGMNNSKYLSGFGLVNDLWIHLAVKPECISMRRIGSMRTITGRLRMSMQDENGLYKSYPEPKKGYDLEKAAARVAAIVRGHGRKRNEARKGDRDAK